MNLGFDAKRIFYNRSGLGNYGRNLINALLTTQEDIQISLYSPIKKNPLVQYNNPRIRVINPEGIFYRRFGSLWRSFILGKKITKDRIDIFHGLSNELPHNIHKREVKSVVTIHDLIFLRYPELYKLIDRKIYNKKFKYACLVADRIIAISEQTKQDIIEFYKIEPEKIDVVYQGCNPVFLRRAENIEDVKGKYNLPSEYMINVGTIEKRKNLITILKALSMEKIDFPLVVAGKPTEYLNEVNEFIIKSGLKNIIILNYVPIEDLPALYQGARLFLYPSVFEGFGIPVLEAINSRVPVITTNYGCFREAGGNAAFYINPEDPEEMAVSIKKILDDDELQMQLIDAGIKHAESFTDEVIADKLMKVYSKVLNNE